MNWLWLNIALGALIFLAVSGIPLWMVIKHPDTAPAWPEALEGGAAPALAAVPAATPGTQAEREAARETVGAAA
jgi:hypothetical protein